MQALNKAWQTLDKAVFGLVKAVCVVLLSVLVVVVFMIFFGRYVLNSSPMWGEPLSLFCLVWMSILGSALVVRENEHIRVTIFDEKLPEKVLFALDILATVCMAAFAVFMMRYGWELMQSSKGNTMAGINISFGWMYLSMPVTGALYVLGLIEMWRGRLVK